MTTGEPTVAELAAAAEIAWRDLLVAESQGLQADGCCSTDVWRGHLCSYHQGFEDGIDVVLERLRAIEVMVGPFSTRDLIVVDRLLAEWPSLSGDHAMDVMELRTKVRRALAAVDEGRTGEWESDAD